jgi:RNA polymerase sigma-70 factor (ECF subfamily)
VLDLGWLEIYVRKLRMPGTDSTCWTLVRDAAAGASASRAEFAARYEPVVRSYLALRWRGSSLLQGLDDAVQDVFVECLRTGGILERAQADRPGGFRAFLFGSVRHVAQRLEKRWATKNHREPAADLDLGTIPGREEALSRVFDRAFARSLMREAAKRQSELAAEKGADAGRRVEILRLRFQEGLPIREIAQLWSLDAAYLHHQYALARREFRSALRDVVSFHHPDTPEEVDAECAKLLSLLE